MNKIIYILATALLYLPQARSQGITNNGSYIKISSGAILRVLGNKGNFANNKSGALNGKVQNDGKIYVQGNWKNYADAGNLFINRNGIGKVEFNGTSRQIIDGSQKTYFENLRINNTYGTSPQIVMAISTNIDNQFTMTKGNINMAGYTLTLGTAAATPGTLSHNGTMANGWLYGGSFMRYFNTATIADRNAAGLFPLGTAIDFRPFYVSHPSIALTTGGTITLTHTGAITAVGVNFADGASTVIRRDDSYWTVSTDAGITAAGTPFNLNAEGTGFGLVTDVMALRLTLLGSVVGTSGLNAGTTTNPQINRTGLSLLNLTNNFYPASTTLSSPLPVALISFDALCNDDKVNINWTTASETNNDFFTVYKSIDATIWVELASISGAGNSNQINNYSFNDNDYTGNIAYYQLKQTDYDGSSTLFNISSVNCFKAADPSVSIYPNPFSTNATIMITDASQSNNYVLKIYNILGTEVINSLITNQSTMLETSNLPAGIYSYTVFKNDELVQSGKLISQK
jgi:hypothetical protein